MKRSRVVAATLVAFVVSNISAIAIHGFALAADYEPFEGTLLRSVGWQMLFLPVVHLSVILYAPCGSTCAEAGWLGVDRGLQLGIVGWTMGQEPCGFCWYAGQPWPGVLVLKQLGLELVSSLVIGLTIATVARVPRSSYIPAVAQM